MSGLSEFSGLIHQKIKEGVPVQTLWAKVKSVDETKRLMIATSLIDGLDIFNIELGYDQVYKLPKEEVKCLVGKVQNHENAYFLISAEEYNEIGLKVGQTQLKIEKTGYKIDSQNENLKKVLNDLIDEINKIIVIQGTSINVPAMTAIKQRLNKILK
jgi:hypothetical protein